MARTFEEIIGRNLNRILYDEKISQQELAKAVGVSEVAISKMVKGKKVISAERLTAAEKFLGVTHEELTKDEKTVGK
jgi:transcriptional regulator with XRE-family HTH domain